MARADEHDVPVRLARAEGAPAPVVTSVDENHEVVLTLGPVERVELVPVRVVPFEGSDRAELPEGCD